MHAVGKTCSVGRELTRSDDQPFLGIDWSVPCDHPIVHLMNVREANGTKIRVYLCHCHHQIVEDSMAAGMGMLTSRSRHD